MTDDRIAIAPPRPGGRWRPFLGLALAGVVFLLDLHEPAGLDLPALYVAPVLLTFWHDRPRDTILAAALCTVLLAAGLAWSPSGAGGRVELVNRLLTAVGLWVTAVLVIRFQRTGRDAARLAALVQSSDDAIIGETLEGIVTSWNRGAERLFGFSAEEARGRSVLMFVPEDRVAEVTAILARVRRGEHVEHFETERLGRNGARITVSLSVSPVRDATGRIVGGSVIARDVTEARRIEARVRAILDTAVDGIVVIGTDGRMQLVNPAVERMFGYTAGELAGANVSMLMASPIREAHDAAIARYLATGDRHIIGIGREVEGRRKDGTRLPIALSVSETRVGQERIFTGILHDLTELKRTEARLRDQAELARLGQMAAVIAHEVRNPLAGIRGALEVIGRRLPAGSGDRSVLADVVGRLEALNRFVNDLLLFSRPERAVTGPQSIRSLLDRLAGLLRNDPEFAAVTLEVEGPDAVVNVDGALMERALLNLVVNAAQAMKGQGTVRIRTQVENGECRIAVSDAGPGIPTEVLDRIFEPFFTTKHRGTGLGLPIVKRTVEQHGGRLHADSPPGAGATMVVVLPLARG